MTLSNHHSAESIYGFCKSHWPETHTPEHHYVLCLHRLSQLESMLSEPVMKKHNLSSAEFDILATLRRTAPPHVLSPTELQRSTLLSSGGQTKVLYQLEEKGLIDRSVNPDDKRSKFVHLSPAGIELVETAMEQVLARLRESLAAADMKKKEVKQLIGLLGKLLAPLENQDV